MPGTYSQLLYHIVFSTKHRTPWINADCANKLYPFIGGTIRKEGGSLLERGGIADHIHLLIRWRPDESISNLLRVVKSRSSAWVHETYPQLSDFAWQEGYGAFSVSKSNEDAVKHYIATQEDHHKKFDFKSELLKLLHAHEIEYDDRYIFD
jgi:putative transposase